ncbi:MAG TPA: RsmG family class I SAM-dependent methyltransferase [Actinomycetota bacterium]|nr:RsmG family class I SAM-dependent methyltransferase [Actinomycetota bacterium]
MSAEELLAAYAALVRKWAPRLDLVSPRDLDRLEERHIEDSLRVAPLLDELPPGPCADIGSGAGFPGVPLAIARPDRRWTLIEPRHRLAAFLEEVVRALGVNARVAATTVELCGVDEELRGSHVLATARAVDEAAWVQAAADPLLLPGGVAVWFKGSDQHKPLPPEAEEWAPGLIIMRKPFELLGDE